MAMTDKSQRPHELDDDDWLALLAGRPAPDASPRTRREADILRQAVLARQTRFGGELADADLIRGRERLRFQLRREAPPPAPIRPGWRRPALLAGLAAGLASIALLPLLRTPDLPSPGTGPGLQPPPRVKQFRLPTVVRADQPAVGAHALAESLNRLGIAVRPVQQAERWLIDVPLPDPPPAELAALLAGHGLRPPPDRRLLVEFAPKPTESPR
jgi:hypothetical protein